MKHLYLALLIGVVIGALIAHSNFLAQLNKLWISPIYSSDPAKNPYAARPIVPCPSTKYTNKNILVLATFGQSNAANYGGTRHTATHEVTAFDWTTGKCRLAIDPLPGSDGVGGSVWGLMADELLKKPGGGHLTG